MLGIPTAREWDVALRPDGRQLLAEGDLAGHRWAVVSVANRGIVTLTCLHLRYRGVTATEHCVPGSAVHSFTAIIVRPPGAAELMVFGLLPAGVVRAEVALDGSVWHWRERDRPTSPVQVRTQKSGSPYLAAVLPVPVAGASSGARWEDGSGVDIRVFDARGQELRPVVR